MNILRKQENFWFNKWLDHVESFMNKCQLWPENSEALIGLSGGRDSVMLLLTLKGLHERGRLTKLKAIHINHGTRPECVIEETFVVELCRVLEVECETFKENLKLEKGNFEKTARDARYKIFNAQVEQKQKLYLAHHLDDSFEWSLASKLKSSNLVSQLGIPVINGNFARPFLCVSRDQISRMLERLGQAFLDDESNDDPRFEKGFLRKEIGPKFKTRFPNYLAHYVRSHNSLAKNMGLWRPKPGAEDFVQKSLPLGGVILVHPELKNDFSGAERKIRQVIHQLSGSVRGTLGKQIDNLITASSNSKLGPLLFSGKVEGYLSQGVICFLRQGDLELLKQYDLKILEILKKYNIGSQIPLISLNMLRSKYLELPFPALVFSKDKQIKQTLKMKRSVHPLLELSTRYCLDNDIWFGESYKLLYRATSKLNLSSPKILFVSN